MNNAIFNSMTELQFINLLYKENNIFAATSNDIDSAYFTTYKNHFEFIIDHYNKYSALPSKESFQAKFGDEFEWLYVSESEEFLVAKLKEAKLYRDIVVDYKEIGNLIKDEKTDEAIEKMAILSQQYAKTKEVKCVDLIDDASLRFDSYMERVEHPDESFVTTGLKELDDILGGWDRKNETATICARTGQGKSWWLIYFAMAAAKAGLTVGYYSGEMEIDLVGYRLDTFLGNLANGSLTHGNEKIKDQYTNYIESLNKVVKGHIYCITPDNFDGKVTVQKLNGFVEKYNIDILCVDQFSLLDDQQGAKTPREQSVNISKDLRKLQRMKKIPVLIAVQSNREEYEEGLNTRNIAESDRIGQDSTTVLFIERSGDNVTIKVGKSRNARTGDKLTYVWNVNLGTLHYIPTEDDAEDGVGSDVLLESYSDSQKSDSVF